MLRQMVKAIARQVPAVDRVIKQRDELLHKVHQSSTVWTIPKQKLDALPPISELLSSADNQRPDELVKRLFVEENSVQTDLLRSLTASELRSFIAEDQHQIPKPETRALYFGDQHASYWFNGLSDYLYLLNVLAQHNYDTNRQFSFLDFGCSSGRVLRHFVARSPFSECFGTDVFADAIQWMRHYLPSRGIYFQNTFVPGLPLPDSFIDLLYAGSIFSHMDEFEDAWLLEFRRILKPGGIAFITFMSERTWAELHPDHPIVKHLTDNPYRSLLSDENSVAPGYFTGPLPAARTIFRHALFPLHNIHSFFSTDYVISKWSSVFEISKIIQRAHGAHQDAVILIRK